MGTASPAPNSLVCTASLVPDTLSHAVSLAMAPVTPVSPLQQGAGLRAQDEQHLVTSSLPWHLPQVVLEWRAPSETLSCKELSPAPQKGGIQ